MADVLPSGPTVACEQPDCQKRMPVFGDAKVLSDFTTKHGERTRIYFCSLECNNRWLQNQPPPPPE
jgi:hypothetical protein